MTLYKIFLSLAGTAILFAGILSVQASATSLDTVWLDGLVLTKAGKTARSAKVTIRNADGDKIMATTTDDTGNFVLTHLPVSVEAYTVVIKHSGDAYRYTMLIDDLGYSGHQAELFRLAPTESKAINLNDKYAYYRAGMRNTDSEGKIIYLKTRTPETDYPYTELYSYYIETGKAYHLDELMERIGYVQRNGVDFSSAGRHVASVSGQQLKAWHVNKLDRILKRSLNDDEYFASSASLSPNYEMEWLDNECIRAAIYQADPTAEQYAERKFLEYRTYCL